ncbi:MAG TPA: IPT/TIG domain-containing protein, partial [Pyrinomonadaceae bacterium]|nr:IPT/TIG domain-containing protein [Pyrinomonadaceae bacterium]
RFFRREMFPQLTVVALMLLFLATPRISAQQGAATTYVYDDDGRLMAVISPEGEASVYEYDAAGNFTAIRRLTPNELSVLTFAPGQGGIGTSVTIYGTGFNQGVSAVSFNGVAASISSTNLASVVAVVPAGATTGPITVVTSRGSVTSARPFVVRGVRVLPAAITIGALETVQFVVMVSGTPTSNVSWSVNGEVGGNQSLGTISGIGFYTAPSLVSDNAAHFVVHATSVDDEELFGEAAVTVLPFGLGHQFRSDGLTVRYGTPPNNPPTFINGAVSVRYGMPPNSPPAFINGAVSVRYGTPQNNPPIFVNGAVSVTRGPVLSAVTPAAVTRGASTSLTIEGVALNGATSISFFNRVNGTLATGITISNIAVNNQGTSLTATITVAGDAPTGSYVVTVTTPAGSTLRNDVGSNLLQVN